MYALYKGEELLSMGTIFQIAQDLNIKVSTVKYYGTDSYKRKLAKRKIERNREVAAYIKVREISGRKKWNVKFGGYRW